MACFLVLRFAANSWWLESRMMQSQSMAFPSSLADARLSAVSQEERFETQDALDFSVLAEVRPIIETLPLAKAEEAYKRMMAGKARFRMVLTMT